MNATETVRAYYDALRGGDPLGPYFADGEPTVKYGISERLVGLDAVRAGLRAQTETTSDWAVESHGLRVTERRDHAWFSDEVRLAWTDVERGVRHDYRTRWSGTLERGVGDGATGGEASGDGTDVPWRFVAMHVSVAGQLADGE